MTGIQNAIGAMFASIYAAIGAVSLERATQNVHVWNGFLEVVFLSVTGPLITPIAWAIGRTVGKFAMPLAERGFKRAAWSVASASDPKSLLGPVTTAFKGIRGQLAHADSMPRSMSGKTAFLERLQSSLGEQRIQLLESTKEMNDFDLDMFYEALKSPELRDVGLYKQGINVLLDQFDANRIAELGNLAFGTREVAIVKQVKFKDREYLVVLESFGMHHLALELNGANMDASKPETTMDSLVFVRLVDPSMHSIAIEQTKGRRGEDSVEYIDFDRPGSQANVPWFRDMRRALKSRHSADDAGERVATDPFGLHLPEGSTDETAL